MYCSASPRMQPNSFRMFLGSFAKVSRKRGHEGHRREDRAQHPDSAQRSGLRDSLLSRPALGCWAQSPALKSKLNLLRSVETQVHAILEGAQIGRPSQPGWNLLLSFSDSVFHGGTTAYAESRAGTEVS